MARRNDKAKTRAVKQGERGANVIVKLGCLGVVCYFVYLESNRPGTVNTLAWAFVFGAFFGKEFTDRIIGGGRR